MSSFFTIPGSQKKRKRAETNGAPQKRSVSMVTPAREIKSTPRQQRDDSISGSDSESDAAPDTDAEDAGLTSGSEEEGSGDEEQTAAERRLRLAERYLQNIRTEVEDDIGFDAEDVDRDLIAERLQEDVAESKGKLYRKLAPELDFSVAGYSVFKRDSKTITSVATCAPYAYTVSKDMWLVKWRIQNLPSEQFPQAKKKKSKKPPPPPRRKPQQIAAVKGKKEESKNNSYRGHTDAILTVAASSDGKFVVTGGQDRRLIIWDAETLKPLRVFAHHRDAVTSVAFRRGTNQLYSSSKDRTVKIWSLDELAYVQTLFGHGEAVVDIAALAQERCVSVGGRDRTARLWKIVEETQQVFRGGGNSSKSRKADPDNPKVSEGCIDRVAMVDEELFITGSDNGSLSLWSIHKKKPIFTVPLCHGVEEPLSLEEASAETNPDPKVVPRPQPRWITALTTIPYSDLVLSGSWDGFVRVWRISDDKKKLEAVGTIASLSPPQFASPDTEMSNGVTEAEERHAANGVVNDISVFERGERGKDGICVVVALGKEHRLGRWMKLTGRNGAVVFEIPKKALSNGAEEAEEK